MIDRRVLASTEALAHTRDFVPLHIRCALSRQKSARFVSQFVRTEFGAKSAEFCPLDFQRNSGNRDAFNSTLSGLREADQARATPVCGVPEEASGVDARGVEALCGDGQAGRLGVVQGDGAGRGDSVAAVIAMTMSERAHIGVGLSTRCASDGPASANQDRVA